MPINPLQEDQSGDESQQNQKNQAGQTGVSAQGQPSTQISGASSATGAGGVKSAGTPGAVQNTAQNNFTNFNQYEQANADQAAGLGSKVAGAVESGANKATGELSQAGQDFATQNQAQGVDTNKYSTQNLYNTLNNVFTNPSTVSSDDIAGIKDVQSRAANLAAGTDTGPKNLADLSSYQTAKGDLTNAENQAQLTGSESGRQTLLQQQFARPTYSQGQSSLDQLLLQNAPANKQLFQNVSNSLLGQYGLASQDTQAIQNAAQARQDVVNNAQNANNDINNILTGTAPTAGATNPNLQANQYGLQTQYLSKLAAQPGSITNLQQQQYNDAKQTIVDALNKAGLGGLATQNSTTLDALVQRYLSEQTPSTNINLQNTLTAPQIQTLQELSQLQGTPTVDVNGNALDVNNLTPGSITTAPTLDASGLSGAIQQSLNSYGSTIKTGISNGLNQTVNTYGSGKPLSQAASDAVNLLFTPMKNPTMDVQETNKVVSALQQQISALNSARAAAGFGPIDQNALNASIAQAQKDLTAQVTAPISTATGYTGPANKIGQEILNSKDPYVQKDPYYQSGLQAISNAAQIQAMTNLLNSYQTDPLQGTNYSNLTNPNYFNNLIGSQLQNQVGTVNNPQPAPVAIEGSGTGVAHTVDQSRTGQINPVTGRAGS